MTTTSTLDPTASGTANADLLPLLGGTPSPGSAPPCRTRTPASGPSSNASARAE